MKSYAQNSEDLIILSLMKPGFFVELGAGDGYFLSNCRLLRENGWTGVSFDYDPKGADDVIQAKITKENVMDYVPRLYDIDFLSIDLDGNDFWILAEILKYVKPKAICCEINSQVGLNVCVTINYDADRLWDGTNAFGMSFEACKKLLEFHGYSITHIVNNMNVIAFLEKPEGTPKYLSFEKTYSHPEEMGKSYWVEVTNELIKNL